MVNYANSKIYKLVSEIDNMIYVGSTTRSLAQRKGEHLSKAKKKPRKVHDHFNSIGWENVSIILVEAYPCENIEVLRQRERHWIDTLGAELNRHIPSRSKKQWYEENKETLLPRMREKNQHNKEHRKEVRKAYYEKNKKAIQQAQRAYNEKNKEKKREYDKLRQLRRKAQQ